MTSSRIADWDRDQVLELLAAVDQCDGSMDLDWAAVRRDEAAAVARLAQLDSEVS